MRHEKLLTAPTGLSIAELILAFHRHATRYDRAPDGHPTKGLLAMTPAGEFRPLKLKAARQKMIDGGPSRALIKRCSSGR